MFEEGGALAPPQATGAQRPYLCAVSLAAYTLFAPAMAGSPDGPADPDGAAGRDLLLVQGRVGAGSCGARPVLSLPNAGLSPVPCCRRPSRRPHGRSDTAQIKGAPSETP